MLKVKKTKRLGRGVFTTAPIKKGQMVELSPLVVIEKARDSKAIENTLLGRYTYAYKKTSAIALGLGSLFNHNTSPNLDWKVLEKSCEVIFWADRDISAGEQLFINYGYNPAK